MGQYFRYILFVIAATLATIQKHRKNRLASGRVNFGPVYWKIVFMLKHINLSDFGVSPKHFSLYCYFSMLTSF